MIRFQFFVFLLFISFFRQRYTQADESIRSFVKFTCVIQNILYVIGHDYHGLNAKERSYKILMTNIYLKKITKLFEQLIVHYIDRS